uniref:DhaK domain-containing protein n=1 Tax=Aegilops tauschii subsp. strangulata TaxID=200361 RepID=A0A453H823_AEGTS
RASKGKKKATGTRGGDSLRTARPPLPHPNLSAGDRRGARPPPPGGLPLLLAMALQGKKLINNPDDVVTEFIEGLVETYPGLQYLDGFPEIKVVLRADAVGGAYDKVAVISGGGSGHEPAHAGFVGPGMLTAAVSGDVFASPPVDSILAAIRAVTGTMGCLLIIKNYTGDRLNFGLAAEQAKSEGYKIEVDEHITSYDLSIAYHIEISL